MSTEEDKFKRSKRLLKDENAVKKQVRIAKAFGIPYKEAHKFAKHHALSCGNPDCVMCMNPRKSFGEPTMQERKFNQRERIIERSDD